MDETYQGQSLVLSLTPQGTQLDGAKITCRVTTTNHKVFEKTVAIVVKGRPGSQKENHTPESPHDLAKELLICQVSCQVSCRLA